MAAEDYVIAGGTGALGGAGTGAAIGSAIAPGIGTAIGAGLGAVAGGVLGIMGQSQAYKQEDEQKRLLKRQQARARKLAAKQRSVERRALAQQKEAASRSVKEGMTIPSPKVSTNEIDLSNLFSPNSSESNCFGISMVLVTLDICRSPKYRK